MKAQKIVLVVTVLAIGLIGLVGCTKKEQPVAAPPKVPAMEGMMKQANTAAEEVNKTATTAGVEQTMCPVMEGNKIDKNVFVEYKGKKVYFCCTSCKAIFEKDPEKYIAKLPQFTK
jgi:YHS domain-containing protein